MYAYVKHKHQACPGCALAYPNSSKSSELVYNFPIKAHFLVMIFNAYSVTNTLVMMGLNATLSAAAGCAVLPAWNLSLVLHPRQQS
jgi:hypothetical protein